MGICEKGKEWSLRPDILSSFPSTPLLLNLSPPNNVLLIISPWLARLRGWAPRPGPLMGICDAPKSLLKWPAGELQGGLLWGRELWCAKVWRGRLHAALHRSVSSTAAPLAGEPLPPTLTDWLAGWLADLLTYSSVYTVYLPKWVPALTERLTSEVLAEGELVSAWWQHGSNLHIRCNCAIYAFYFYVVLSEYKSPEVTWIQVLLQRVEFPFFFSASPAISFISCQAAHGEKIRSGWLFSARSLCKCAIGNFFQFEYCQMESVFSAAARNH